MNYFKIPENLIIDKRIFKNEFYKQGDFRNSEKKVFQEEIEQVNWKASLKESNLNIAKYENKELLYEEIEVIEIDLKKKRNFNLIIEKVQRNIHYPLILIIKYNKEVCFSGALKNKNKVDRGKLVIEKLFMTDWIDLNTLNKQEKEFLKSLEINNYSFIDFYKFYLDYINRIVSFNIYKESLDFKIQEKNDIKNNALVLEKIDFIGKEIIALKGRIKKETQFNKKLYLNKKIKNKKNEVKDLRNKLK